MESSAVNAVGVWFYAVDTQRYLYLMRDDPKHPNTWGLPGGRMEPGETMIESIKRECEEELGAMPDYIKLVPLEKFTTADQHFAYHTFFCTVSTEFVPELNHEHTGWAWLASGVWPRPMHPGLWSTVNFDAVRDKITTMELAVQTSQ
jgi:ADP-ribose pyrophosphatase YjhB (NUDIX family)